MDLKLKVIGNQSAVQSKQERNPDGSIKQVSEKITRVTARNDSTTLSFQTDYESGKTFELDRELTVTIQ